MKRRFLMIPAIILAMMICVTSFASEDELPKFTYLESDALVGGVIRAILDVREEQAGADGVVSIPIPVLEYFDLEDEAHPAIWGCFGYSDFTVIDDSLVERRSELNRGCMDLLLLDDGTYAADSLHTEELTEEGESLSSLEGWNDEIGAAMNRIDGDLDYVRTYFLKMYCRSAAPLGITNAQLLDGSSIDLSDAYVTEEEAEIPVVEDDSEQYPAFEYDGSDAIEAAVLSALISFDSEELEDANQDLIAIPCPVMEYFNMNDPGSVEIWGDFGIANYSLDGPVLHRESGVEKLGKIVLSVSEDGSYAVADTAFVDDAASLPTIAGWNEEIEAALANTDADRENVRVRFLTMYCRMMAPLGITSCEPGDGTVIDLSGAYETAA